MENDCPIPGSAIPIEMAKQRKKKFEKGKYELLNKWMNNVHPGAKEQLAVIFQTGKQFEDLLNKTGSTPKVNGIRFYFANFPKNSIFTHVQNYTEDQLTLVFAPTFHNGSRDTDYCGTDYGDYFVVDLDNPQKMRKLNSCKEAAEWVNEYRKTKLLLLEENGKNIINKRFRETSCIWFGISQKNNFLDWGCILREYNKLHTNSIVSAQISFATYRNFDEYKHKLGVVIEITDTKNGKLKIIDLEKFLGDKAKEFFQSGTYDTGKPCPPPTNGCSTTGAMLPS